MNYEFLIDKYKNLKCLSIPLFKRNENVIHAFTTRWGGVSKGCYSSLNMAFHVGDNPRNVLANRKRVCHFLGIDPDTLVAAQQVHGDKIRVVTSADKGCGAASDKDAVCGTDALVTGEPGVPLSAYFADCAAVFFFDPVKQVIALAHAGWRGTVLRVGEKTVQYMCKEFGSKPYNILAWVSPAIGPCCYEVGEQVVGALRESFTCWEDFIHKKEFAQGRFAERWYFNLWEANKRALLEAGMAPEHIAVAGLCTACRSDMFFSYRRDGGRTGRMAAVLMLR